MNRIKCKQDEVFTTSDNQEFTRKNQALAHQQKLNFNSLWKYHWDEGMDRIRYTPFAVAFYGTGAKSIHPHNTSIRDYILQNREVIKKMLNEIEQTEIEYETK